MGKVDWLESFFENQRGIKCTACSDCDRERDAAEKEIKRLRNIISNTESQQLPPETANPSTDTSN